MYYGVSVLYNIMQIIIVRNYILIVIRIHKKINFTYNFYLNQDILILRYILYYLVFLRNIKICFFVDWLRSQRRILGGKNFKFIEHLFVYSVSRCLIFSVSLTLQVLHLSEFSFGHQRTMCCYFDAPMLSLFYIVLFFLYFLIQDTVNRICIVIDFPQFRFILLTFCFSLILIMP